MSRYGFLLSIMCVLVAASVVSACGPKKKSAWDKVYERARENDSGYISPSVVNCVSDDLYTCN